MEKIFIRQAGAGDAELVATLSRKTFYDTYVNYNSRENMDQFLTEQFTHERLVTEVAQPWHLFYLAYLNEEIAGYVKLRESAVPAELRHEACIEVARIYAVQNAIGKGVGGRLMQTCIDVARQKGKTILWLCVWPPNQRALDFYLKWGFEKCGEQEFMLGNDRQTDWVMMKRLK
jgi:diamine N-acetyltransferase